MDNFQKQCVSVYETISKIPVLDGISVIRQKSKEEFHWQAKWSHRDISRNLKVNIASSGTIAKSDYDLVSTASPFTAEIKNEKLTSVSPSEDLVAKLLEIEIKSEKHYFLEIWKETCKLSSLDLTEEKKHGAVHTNSTFGCLNWSHDNSKLLYIAEKKYPDIKSYFDRTDENVTKGKEYVYKENWGEQLVAAYHPTLFMYDVKSKVITDLSEYFPNNVSLGSALWSHNDSCLYVLAWKSTPWKLGLVYCKNRFSTIYKFDLEKKTITSLTDEKFCVFSPILSPDGNSLFYLQTMPLGPHGQCSKLMCLNLNKSQPAYQIIDVVKREVNSDKFQGLFVDEIIKNCWLTNGKQMIIHSMHRSNIGLLCVNVETGQVNVLENEGMWKILNVCDNILFASYSTPNTPTIFRAGIFNPSKIDWIDIEVPVPKINDVEYIVQKHEPREKNDDFSDLDYESILVRPSDDAAITGLIVNPHGGPHSAFPVGFDLFTACFAQLGFAVLRVNYRGSIGFGQNSILSLPKRVGQQDVSDVQNAAETTVHDLCIPPGKVFVTGGSHGGFLTLHLLGQYPNFYAAGATRNPVTNLATQRGTTDIMDWCYCEGGSEFNFNSVPTSGVLQKFLECSPIVHVAKVKAPVLFMLGSVDLRVPPSQSFEYVHCLQGLGKTVTVLKYDDNNHPISKIDAEADCFVNIAAWFHDNSK